MSQWIHCCSFLSYSPLNDFWNFGPEDARSQRGEGVRLLQIRLYGFYEKARDLVKSIPDKPEWEFQKSCQLVARVDNKAHSVVVVRICNADCFAPLSLRTSLLAKFGARFRPCRLLLHRPRQCGDPRLPR